MSDRTTAPAAPSAPTAFPGEAFLRAADSALRRHAYESLTLSAPIPLYADATPEQRTAIEADMAACLADGLSVEDYLSALADWPNATEYLSQLGTDDDGEPDDDDATASEEQAPVPTATLAQANKTLAAFGGECKRQAEANYRLGELAWQYVSEFLGASPGKAQRSTAVEYLADEWRKWDEESMTVPLTAAMKRLKDRVNTLLAVHAVATLLGDGRGVAKGDGTKRGKGKGAADTRVAWGALRELRPLVFREESEHAETWHVVPSVADKARSLVSEIASSGMARKDVVASVAKLMLADAELELTAARESEDAGRIKAAEAAVLRWDGKVEKPEGKAAQQGKGKASAETDDSDDDADDDSSTDDAQGKPSGECRADNLLKSAGDATPKDAAQMAYEFLMQCSEPESAAVELLKLLAECKELRPSTRNALKPVAFQLADDDSDNPADANANASDKRKRDAQAALASLKGPMIDDDAEVA